MRAPHGVTVAAVQSCRRVFTAVRPRRADEHGRFHLVEVEHPRSAGHKPHLLLREEGLGAEVPEAAAFPRVGGGPPMGQRGLDATSRAGRWSALAPSSPSSGVAEDSLALAVSRQGTILRAACQRLPVVCALEVSWGGAVVG
jgi:hypothetical protein